MSKNQELQRIKSALAKRPKGPGRRIPPEVRCLIARYAQRRVSEGAAQAKIAKEVGVCGQTLCNALKRERADMLVPVRVLNSAPASATVRGPGGLTIEGLDIEALAELIRALS